MPIYVDEAHLSSFHRIYNTSQQQSFD